MTLHRPLVTVALPTLRRPAYLEQTLASLVAQTYLNLEILVSDNGSGDNTPDVVARFEDPRIRFRSNVSTVPFHEHFNQLIDEARGEYLVIVSDDDLVSPNFVEALIESALAHPKAKMILPRCDIIDERGNVTQKMPPPPWEAVEGTEYLFDWLYGRLPVMAATHISLFARTSDLRHIGGHPPFTDGANGDNAVALALSLLGDVAFARDAIFYYRVYTTSYGLAISYDRLASSAQQFRDYLRRHSPVASALNARSRRVRKKVTDGVSRMLAKQYLTRLRTLYLPRNGLVATLKGVAEYQPDAAYIRELPVFAAAVGVTVAADKLGIRGFLH